MSHNKFMKKYEMPIIKDDDERALTELNKHIQAIYIKKT